MMGEDKNSIFLKFKNMIEEDQSYFFDSQEYEEIIEYYIEKGEFEIAQQACQFGREQYPFSVEILSQKSQLSILIQKVNESIVEIHEFFDENGFDENLLFILSSHYSQKGELKKSIQCLDKVKEEFTESSELYYQYGASFFVSEKYSEAINYFKKSLELDVKNEDALYDLSFCFELEGKLEESIEFYKQFIDNDPYSCYSWYNLGVIYNKLFKFKEAINAFEYAYTIKNDFSSAYYNIGNSYVCLKEWDKAIANFNLCAKYESPSADVYAKIGECYELKDDYAKAIENYRKAIELDPDKVSALMGLTNILHHQGKNKEAIHFINKCIILDEFNDTYWLLLANCEHNFGNETSALEAYEKSLDLNSNNIQAYNDYSHFYYDKQQFEDAFNVVLEGLNIIPDNSDLNYLAFVFGLKAGKYKESLPFLENALFLAPEKKEMVFKYFEDLDAQKAILRLIEGTI